MSLRKEIRELCIAHDKQMAEDGEWLARRKAQARPFVRKSEDAAGLIFKTVENAAVSAPQPDPAPHGEPTDAARPFTEAQIDVMAHVINHLRAEWDNERAAEAADRNAELARLQVELDELRRRVNALIQ